MLLKIIIVEELMLAMIFCYIISAVWYHSIQVRFFSQISSSTASAAAGYMTVEVKDTVKTYMESVGEEVYEYVWTTEKIDYRTGADSSYEKAGTLAGDTMVRRTGITHNGWNRISLIGGDEKDYYIPEGKLSDNIPESLPIAAGIKGEYQKYALSLFPDHGWDSSELVPLINLWNRESKWNPSAHNRHSGAHGIPQALPASKMASEGSDYYTNPEPQIRWGLKYIANRYGSPSNAWAHSESTGWY